MEWMLLPLRRYAEFSGRSRRKEYWMWYLFVILVFIVTFTLDSMLGLGGHTTSYGDVDGMSAAGGFNSTGGLLTAIASLALLVPGIAVSIRRLHDVDKSGWFLLIALIPFGALYLLYLFVQPGTAGPNRFGADPLAGEAVA